MGYSSAIPSQKPLSSFFKGAMLKTPCKSWSLKYTFSSVFPQAWESGADKDSIMLQWVFFCFFVNVRDHNNCSLPLVYVLHLFLWRIEPRNSVEVLWSTWPKLRGICTFSFVCVWKSYLFHFADCWSRAAFILVCWLSDTESLNEKCCSTLSPIDGAEVILSPI